MRYDERKRKGERERSIMYFYMIELAMKRYLVILRTHVHTRT